MDMKKLLETVLAFGLCVAMGLGVSAAMAAEYRPQVAAHRGASAYLPEHTLEAKAYAYALGVDYIEQDVVMTKDGRLVVMHDVIVDTTTDVAEKFPGRARDDGRYYACDFTYDELRSLRLTERFNPKTGAPIFPGRFPDSPIDYRIPSLEEEFYQIVGLNKSTGRNVKAYVEVKEPYFFLDQGLDVLKATVDMMTEFGFNTPDSGVILQIFDYEAVVRARTELGWKGDLAMLVTAGGQGKKDDKARHAWLQTPEGMKDVAKYANIYAPSLALIAVPNADGSAYTTSALPELARENGMSLHIWTLRKDSLHKGFKSFDEILDYCFKEVKVDAAFADFPDLVIDYLKANGLR